MRVIANVSVCSWKRAVKFMREFSSMRGRPSSIVSGSVSIVQFYRAPPRFVLPCLDVSIHRRASAGQ
jgi:hypothetical protein